MKESDHIIRLMQAERECVSRDCDRKCGDCDLAQDREELIQAYNVVIETLQTLRDFFTEDHP